MDVINLNWNKIVYIDIDWEIIVVVWMLFVTVLDIVQKYNIIIFPMILKYY